MNAITKQEGGALSLQAPRQQFDLSPQTFEQALTFAKYLADSDMVPKNFRGKPGDCLVAMQWGYEVNLKPLQALQSIAVINGKPGLFGDAGKAILLAAGCDIDEDDTEVVKQRARGRCKITRPGRTPVERTFSLEDAKTAGLWNKDGPWRTYPFRQMAWRAFWFAARDAASDLLRGLAGIEELGDIPEKHMGMADEVQPAAAPTAPPERPVWPDDAFNLQFPRWEKAVLGGLKSVDDILALARSKGALTEAQEQAIRGIKLAPQEPDPFVVEMEAAERQQGGAQ